jgi:hypothetical protein
MFTLGLVAHATLFLISLNIIACNVHPKSCENSIYMDDNDMNVKLIKEGNI